MALISRRTVLAVGWGPIDTDLPANVQRWHQRLSWTDAKGNALIETKAAAPKESMSQGDGCPRRGLRFLLFLCGQTHYTSSIQR